MSLLNSFALKLKPYRLQLRPRKNFLANISWTSEDAGYLSKVWRLFETWVQFFSWTSSPPCLSKEEKESYPWLLSDFCDFAMLFAFNWLIKDHHPRNFWSQLIDCFCYTWQTVEVSQHPPSFPSPNPSLSLTLFLLPSSLNLFYSAKKLSSLSLGVCFIYQGSCPLSPFLLTPISVNNPSF